MVTGGTLSQFSVTRYDQYGVVNDPDLPYLPSGRWAHACAKYLNDQQQTVIFIFYLLASVEKLYFTTFLAPTVAQGSRCRMCSCAWDIMLN